MEAYIGTRLGDKDKEEISIELDVLKKHFIALGGSGSGKTVLCKVLIEEAITNKIPSILVDPQGDLGSLGLFDAESLSRGSGRIKESKVIIYTPTSNKGIPICLSPFKLPKKGLNEEDVISIINTIAVSICRLLGYNLENDKGKSASAYLYKLLFECYGEGSEISDFNNLSQVIEARGEDELLSKTEIGTLVKRLKLLTIGEKDLLFNFGVKLNIKQLLKNDVSVIYLNTLNSGDKDFFLSMLCKELYEYMLLKPSKNLQALFYVDEISTYIPAGNKKTLSRDILRIIFKQARKYGIGCIISTQNPGDIDYKAFSQFSTWAIGRLTAKQDRAKVKESLKAIAGDEVDEITSSMAGLKPGEFVIFSPDIFEKIEKIKVRWLYSEHKTLNLEDIKTFMDRYRSEFKVLDSKFEKIRDNTGTEDYKKRMSGKERKHFRIRIKGESLNKLINKNKKKMFKFFGPDKEKLEGYTLNFIPFYKTKVRVIKKNLLGIKKNIKDYEVYFNALDGSTFVFKQEDFKRLEGFERLIGLTENELQVIKVLNKKDNLSSAEIGYEIGVSKQMVGNTLKGLLNKKIATYDKVSKQFLWSLLIKIDKNNIPRIESKANLEYSEIESKLKIPKVKSEQINELVRGWFGTAEVIEEELVYYPIYELRYIDKKGNRDIRISAVNGEVF
ncbi:DUF853 family protein [Candidatus Woesearchaeota archaeon]|nr:DUF853 family protein [Candidatus Woesearchaeota archaeon]